MLIPHRIESLGFDLCDLDALGCQYLPGTGALLCLLLLLAEAKLSLFPLL